MEQSYLGQQCLPRPVCPNDWSMEQSYLGQQCLASPVCPNDWSMEQSYLGQQCLPRPVCPSHCIYTPSIYALEYIVFVFPFVCLYVRLFVRDSVLFVELLQSFTLKFLKCNISQQPLIRKHSYLDHRYTGVLAFSPLLLTPGSMPQGGARGQKLGHL